MTRKHTKINFLSLFKIFKEKVLHETKFYLFTAVLPIVGLSYFFYNAYKYNMFALSFWTGHVYSVSEEKQIAKKIFPVLKYKNVDKLCEESSREYEDVYRIYKDFINFLKFNLKIETFVIKSDLIFLHILPTGSLFISDAFYYLIKESHKEDYKAFLSFFILHNIIHIRNRDTVKNVSKIYSKFDLVKQYHKLMDNEIGYEHYFLNYYLYLPFSREQEVGSIIQTLKVMKWMNLEKFSSEKEIEEFLNEVEVLFSQMKMLSNVNKSCEEMLKAPNKRRVEIIENSIVKEFGKVFEFSFEHPEYPVSKFYDENNQNLKNIIYGDYKYKNENVEVYLHQRTMKKVKYKKREYEFIHPVDKQVIENILRNKDEINEIILLNKF